MKFFASSPGRRWHFVGLLAIALTLPAASAHLRLFLASWLAAWWFVVGLMLGGMANLWVHRLSGGRWGDALRPVALSAAQRMPLAVLLFAPIAAGLAHLYPWAADPSGGWTPMAQPAFARWWLAPGCFAVRGVVYAAVWWWLAQPATLASKGRSAAALVLYALSITLAAVDLLMSLVPGWFSTGFGLVVLAGQALGGTALATLELAVRRPQVLLQCAGPAPSPPIGRDLGNLLLMWAMTWAYLAFMEFLIIWAEDLPPEVRWYVPRLHTGWSGIGLALMVTQLGLPVLALLQRSVKDHPVRLAPVAALLLVSQLLNTAWLVLPSVDPHGTLGWWLVPQLALGMGLLLVPSPTRHDTQGLAPQAAEVRHGNA